MTVLALTGSPILEPGVTLNVMSTPQVADSDPVCLRCGETVHIRFGHCCPLLAEGTIIEADANHLVMTLGGTCWTLRPGPTGSGVRVPGIVSDDWIVC